MSERKGPRAWSPGPQCPHLSVHMVPFMHLRAQGPRFSGREDLSPRAQDGSPKRCRKRLELGTSMAGTWKDLNSQPRCLGPLGISARVLCRAVLRSPGFSPQLQSHLSVSRSQEGTRAKPRNSLSNLFQMLRLLALLSCLGTKQLTGEFSGSKWRVAGGTEPGSESGSLQYA